MMNSAGVFTLMIRIFTTYIANYPAHGCHSLIVKVFPKYPVLNYLTLWQVASRVATTTTKATAEAQPRRKLLHLLRLVSVVTKGATGFLATATNMTTAM